MLQQINHGISTGALFLIVGILYVPGPVTLAGRLMASTGGGFKPQGEAVRCAGLPVPSGKVTILPGSPSYPVAYHATSMDVAFC